MNEQPCHFTVITDELVLDQVSINAKAWLLDNIASFPRPNHFRDLLKDEKFDDTLARRGAEAAFATAMPRKHNAFKIELGQRVVARALHQAATMEV